MTRTLLALFLAALCSACAVQRPATAPMQTRLVAGSCPGKASTLLVFLPGAYSIPEEFEREGFLHALQERRIAADAMLVDAHMGYYNNRSIVDRLEADVFAPARAAGYTDIWMVGISLGGFGALVHEDMRPGGVKGIVALAPYLADRVPSQDAGAGRPALYLGYGTSDRFATSHRLLAAALPQQRVFTTPGGHDWPQWRVLWQQMLPALPLPSCR